LTGSTQNWFFGLFHDDDHSPFLFTKDYLNILCIISSMIRQFEQEGNGNDEKAEPSQLGQDVGHHREQKTARHSSGTRNP
jgi:hypothetical protein